VFGDLMTGATRSFLKDGDAVTTIEVPGATVTAAFGISNHGQIVGTFYDGEGRAHGFVIDGGTLTQIDVPGAEGTEARGINARGQVVGDWGDGRVIYGFIATPTRP
jgi:probable HAF family extracellular repeat protein